jgi:acyl carrier protein
MPLNGNGKIDKHRLPAPTTGKPAGTGENTGPRDPTEGKVIAAWAELLDLPQDDIGIDHNFFDIGGNSLKTIRLSKRLSEIFGRKIGIPVLFEHSTIRSLSDHLKKSADGADRPQGAETPDTAGSSERFDKEELMGDLEKFNIQTV